MVGDLPAQLAAGPVRQVAQTRLPGVCVRLGQRAAARPRGVDSADVPGRGIAAGHLAGGCARKDICQNNGRK